MKDLIEIVQAKKNKIKFIEVGPDIEKQITVAIKLYDYFLVQTDMFTITDSDYTVKPEYTTDFSKDIFNIVKPENKSRINEMFQALSDKDDLQEKNVKDFIDLALTLQLGNFELISSIEEKLFFILVNFMKTDSQIQKYPKQSKAHAEFQRIKDIKKKEEELIIFNKQLANETIFGPINVLAKKYRELRELLESKQMSEKNQQLLVEYFKRRIMLIKLLSSLKLKLNSNFDIVSDDTLSISYDEVVKFLMNLQLFEKTITDSKDMKYTNLQVFLKDKIHRQILTSVQEQEFDYKTKIDMVSFQLEKSYRDVRDSFKEDIYNKVQYLCENLYDVTITKLEVEKTFLIDRTSNDKNPFSKKKLLEFFKEYSSKKNDTTGEEVENTYDLIEKYYKEKSTLTTNQLNIQKYNQLVPRDKPVVKEGLPCDLQYEDGEELFKIKEGTSLEINKKNVRKV